MKILVAPSGFKGSLGADEAAACIERGLKRVSPEAEVFTVPMADGGEGFAKALTAATGGTLHEVEVTGPTGGRVTAHYGVLGDAPVKTAVLEMAAAAGLSLVPEGARDPLTTTTYGVGELIRAALDGGAERVLIGCGDSGTNDGGLGMAQALGVRLLDEAGRDLGPGGGELARLERIDLSGRDPRLERAKLDVACNWHNVLCGPQGVARVFGPQKGAAPETVAALEGALERYAGVIARDLGVDVRTIPGGGASGGLGAGLYALLGAELHPRFKVVMRYLELDSLLEQADLAVTAEGGLDYQTPRGKVPAEIARRAAPYDLPVVVLAGTLGEGAEVNLEHGVAAFESILDAPRTLAEAAAEAAELLERSAERALRLIEVGRLVERNGTAR